MYISLSYFNGGNFHVCLFLLFHLSFCFFVSVEEYCLEAHPIIPTIKQEGCLSSKTAWLKYETLSQAKQSINKRSY